MVKQTRVRSETIDKSLTPGVDLYPAFELRHSGQSVRGPEKGALCDAGEPHHIRKGSRRFRKETTNLQVEMNKRSVLFFQCWLSRQPSLSTSHIQYALAILARGTRGGSVTGPAEKVVSSVDPPFLHSEAVHDANGRADANWPRPGRG
jgi:hypothetical protein